MINFSIIIPNYNGAHFLTDCLNSLKQAINNCPGSEFEIIFVDNNSKDNSIEIFETIIPKNFNYRILLNQKNYGFAGAVNQGIVKAKHEWVALLNNDLTMESNWFQLISKTIKENKNPKIATLFGTVLTKDGTKFESQGLEFSYSGKCQNISNNQPFSKSLLAPRPVKGGDGGGFLVWGASAAFVVYNKKILKQIGLFDEDFFAYEEDVDIALRLHNLNYKTLYVPQAISYHLGGGTSNHMKNIRSRLSYRNWFFIIIKNYSVKDFFKNIFNITIERLRNLSYFFRETNNVFVFTVDFLKTSLEILINLPKMLKKRKQIKKLYKTDKLNK